ncbi:MAG: SDR family oxidoreductase [Cyanobacteria bacterium J06626_18]
MPSVSTHANVTILGCGYVGTALAEFWSNKGIHVMGTTTHAEKIVALEPTVAKAMVAKGNDLEAIRAVFEGQDIVIVSVAPTNAYTVDAAIYAATYLPLAENLVKAMGQYPEVKQIIYLSSCSVYGDRQGAWVDETTPIVASDTHIQVLHTVEQALLQAHEQPHPKVCILRLGGIYGPGRGLRQRFEGIAGKTLPGKGDRIVNWVHLEDVVAAIDFARSNRLEGIYNLVDDSVMTIREQITRVCQKYRLPLVRWDASQPSRARKSLRVRNQKLKTAGYVLLYPTLRI